MGELRIAVIARTVGLEFDDRIRKQCIALQKIAELFIYVNFADNRKECGVTSYGVPYRSFKLKTRDLLPSGKLLLIKSLELYIAIKKHLKNYDYVFAHEEYTYLFPLLSKISKCVWDLHEIPFRFESRIMKLFFHYIERKSKRIHHANPYRIEYLNSNKTIKYPRKHVVVRNFPDQRFILAKETDGEYSRFTKWLGGNAYVYLQGLSNPMRYPINTILSIMNSCNLKAIVVGHFDRMAKMKLIETFSEQKLRERIFFRGMVDQLHIPAYVKNATFSIVLYNTKTPNNRYCEPNRMYQSIALGVPVIVGCNEPMKDMVKEHSFGFVLNSDGKDINEIGNAISTVMENIIFYRKCILEGRDKIFWEQQEPVICKSFLD